MPDVRILSNQILHKHHSGFFAQNLTTNISLHGLHPARKSLRFLVPEPSPDKHLESRSDLCQSRVMLFISPWCSLHWCSDLAPPLPPGSSRSLDSQGLNGEKANWWDLAIEKQRHAVKFGDVTDWGGWFCICLWSCDLEHPALPRWQSSEGSSAEDGDMLSITHGHRRHESQLDERTSR